MMYYVAHARGPDFKKLREKGFTTFYPDLDDYVFLEVKPQNERWLRRQSELGVHFLRQKERYTQVTEAEVQRMGKKKGETGMVEGATILVVEGYASNLEGTVEEADGTGKKLRCTLKGFNRNYDVWVDRMELVKQ